MVHPETMLPDGLETSGQRAENILEDISNKIPEADVANENDDQVGKEVKNK